MNTALRRRRPEVHSRPCTAGSLFSEARYTRCNSNHTLCTCWWIYQDSIVGHSPPPDTPRRAARCLDFGRRYSCQVKYSSGNASHTAGKLGCHPDNVQGSRRSCRCQCGSEQGWCCRKNRRRVLLPGRSCRRSGIFYKRRSLRSIQKGSGEHSGPPVAGGGHSGTSGRYSQCPGDGPHSAGTGGGNLYSTQRG